MSEIWNLSTLCRCCHADGHFKSLKTSYQGENDVEIYEKMLQDTFGVAISTPPVDASYNICDECIYELQVATKFKKQVLLCEEKFMVYCNNEQFLATCDDIKSEENDDSVGIINNDADHIHIDKKITLDVKKGKLDDQQDCLCLFPNAYKTNLFKVTVNRLLLEYSIEVDIKHPIEEEVQKGYLIFYIGLRKATNFSSLESTFKVLLNEHAKVIIVDNSITLYTSAQISTIGQLPGHQTQQLSDVQPKTEKEIVDIKTNNDKTDIKLEVPKKNIRNKKSNATVKKQEFTKNGEQPEKRIKIDRSLIIQVDTETGSQFSCKDCGGLYQTEKDINQHLYKQHTTKYKCEHCPKQYKSFYCYKSHLATHTGNELQCSYCQKIFANKFAYKEHLNTHTRDKNFQCDLCKNNFKYKSTLIRHLRIHAGTNKSILCDLCGHSFNDKSNLNAHVRSVHLKLRLFHCKICEKSFSNKRHLKDHLKLHSGDVKVYTCDICDHKLTSEKLMKVHRLRHDNKFLCRYCPKIFDESALRKEHVNKSHNKEHPWLPCTICGKIFVGKYSLNRHIDSHKGIKKFPCEHCDLKFSQKSVLKQHIFRKHNPEADINVGKTKCHICHHSFKNIILHMSRHSKRRSCDICSRTYADKSALNRHVAQKHLGRTYDCEICNKKYLQRTKLNTHKMKVHNIKIEKVGEGS